MNTLFLTLSNFYDLDKRGIYTDLIREFVKRNHNVCIISPTEKKSRIGTNLIDRGVYKILKLQIGNIQKTNLIEKGITMLTLESKFKQGIRKYFSNIKFDLVIYSTPPITLLNAIKYVKKRDNAKTYLLLKDIFPQNAVDLGLIDKVNPIYWYFSKKERVLYKNSDYIGCMSKANVDYVLKHNKKISIKDIEVCPNSIEPLKIDLDQERAESIKLKYDVPLNKTIFVYGGNLGKPQGIDFVIECIKSNLKNDSAFFLIVGAGTEYNKLKTFFYNEEPGNARLLSMLPKDEYEILVNSCDVGLIFLDKRFTIPNFPSRLLSYMQASIPILATTDVNTDIGKVIEEGKFGLWCESSDANEFSKKVKQLINPSIRKTMGLNARRYLEENYTAKHSYDIIMRHFS